MNPAMCLAWAQWRETLRNVHEELPSGSIRGPPPDFRHCVMCARQLFPLPIRREPLQDLWLYYNHFQRGTLCTWWCSQCAEEMLWPNQRCLSLCTDKFRFDDE